MRKPYQWQYRASLKTCPICGHKFEAKSCRQKFCKSPECRQVLADRKNARRKCRRERLSALGIKTHTEGNK